jgi:hypothetical protein
MPLPVLRSEFIRGNVFSPRDPVMRRWARATVGGCLGVVLLAGCSASPKPTVSSGTEKEPIEYIGMAYHDASTALKRGPANVEEIKPYLRKYGDPDQLLISPNDGQPYHINWGLVPKVRGVEMFKQRVLAYEEVGKGGKRSVLDPMLQLHHLSDAEFTQWQQMMR